MARRLAPLAAAALVLIWHTLQYAFVTDDAYISFVYARNLAEHGALVFNASDLSNPVEGYTNFLWVVLLAAFMVVGISPEISSLAFGAAFALGTMAIVFRLAERLVPDNPIAVLPSALLAVSASFACWASGGLETQMFAFFVVLALWFLARSEDEPRAFRWVGLALALAALTRPEGLLCVGLFGVYRLVRNLAVERRIVPTRPELVCAGIFLGIWLPWFLWRLYYYGYPFPNTYYVKAAGEASAGYADKMRDNGFYYAWTWITQSKILFLAPLAFIGAVATKPSRPAFRLGVFALVFALIYVGYAISVGGDFMGLHRFVMPATVVIVALAGIGVARVAAVATRSYGKWRELASIALAAIVLGVFAFSQFRVSRTAITKVGADRGIDSPAYLELYAHDRRLIGEHMRDCFEPGDFSIFGGVGAKPYHARAEGIDVFGLVSERIAHEVKRTRPRAGHNKWGPDKLLLEHDPDFVFSCYSLHREPTKPGWHCAGFWTRRGYEIVTLHIPGLKERGEYYTFLAKKERRFKCGGRIR